MVDWLIITATAKTRIIIFILFKVRAFGQYPLSLGTCSNCLWDKKNIKNSLYLYNLIYFYFLLKIDVFSLILGKN